MTRIPTIGPISPDQQAGNNDLRDVEMDDFLQLLIAELQNQDPLSPMENSEILQQISQIREISATNLLSETLESVLSGQNLATASSLIGKTIRATTDDGQEVVGVVDRVSFEREDDGKTRRLRVHVGEHQIALENVREIVAEWKPGDGETSGGEEDLLP
jgi:flagellar basal-body rod modification protein FlgD